MRIFDWPPVWLAAALLLVWGFDWLLPWGMFGALGRGIGAALVFLGLGLMLLAAAQMYRAQTTVIPRRKAQRLVTSGVFRLSRNPIYLGDALVLAGVILAWDVPVALPLLLGFILVIQHRFILAEEAALRAAFATDYAAWAAKTRRWL